MSAAHTASTCAVAARRLWDDLRADLRYALRQLRRSPGFAAVITISLAVGIAAATALFSVIYSVLMNPFPYRGADRIVRLMVRTRLAQTTYLSLNGPQIQQLRRSPAIDSVLAVDYHERTLTGHDLPENVHTVYPLANTFEDLGVPPTLGRGLQSSDAIDGQDPQPVAVLGYAFWRKEFLADPRVLGTTLQLDRKNYVIVGVASPRFTWYEADVYLPLKLTQDPESAYLVDLRLKPGVSQVAADAALQPLIDQFAKDAPKQFPEHMTVHVVGLNQFVVEHLSGTLYLLFGAVLLLLAIGCGNASILLMARGTARGHELAVRVAIGAQRGRLVRQLLTESLLLAAIGVGLGVSMSYGILAGIQALLPRFFFAPEVAFQINLPVLAFSGAVALTTGLVFGSWPARQLSRIETGPMVKSHARGVIGSVHGRRTHHALVAGQIALTLLLLAGAGAAIQSFLQLLQTPLGYEPHNVMAVPILLHDNVYTTWPARAAYLEQLRAKIAQTPGVTTAALSETTPPQDYRPMRFEILGKTAADRQVVSFNPVSSGYFAALQIPLLQGDTWSDAENRRGAHVALINRTLARRYFPEGDAVGHSVKFPGIADRPPAALAAPDVATSWLRIVGVVEDARNDGLTNPIRPAVFVPDTLLIRQYTQIVVRSAVPPETMLRAVRAQLAAVDPDQQTFSEVQTLDTVIAHVPEWKQEHLAAWIFGVLAGLGLALAAVGLYSVVSYTVAQRTGEFGIRMALGAQREHVMRIVVASTLVSVGSGLLAGLALVLVMTTVIARWASGNSRDPIVLAAGVVLVTVVSGVACAIPAWQACRVDPMTAMRQE